MNMTADIQAIKPEASEADRQLQALEGASIGLWDWRDPGSHELWSSSHFYRLLGYEPDELSADLVSLDRLIHPSFQAVLFAAFERAWRQQESMDIQIQLRTKSEGYRWFRCQSRVLLDAAGQVQHVAGTLEDIHERKVAQKAAAEAHEQLQAIFSLSDDGYAAFGADGKINFCSPAFYKLTGIEPGKLEGQDETDMIKALHDHIDLKEWPVSLDAMLTATAHARQSATEFANRAVIATRHTPARMLEWRLQRGQGRVTQMLHVRDVTQEIEVERMKSDFLSIAAHELRTPMTSIYGFVSLVLNHTFPPEKQRNLLERVSRQCQPMMDIINELLDLARIEAKGAAEFEFTDVDLCVLANEVIRDFKLPDGREPPDVDWPEDPMLVRVDLKKTRQAVLNVLSNAYKYSPQGGAVHIFFERQQENGEDFLSVRVRDHGIGMTEEQLQHFGERFYRADRSVSIPGTGLGISIVREIVEHMGGAMRVSSIHGQGTEVTLLLRATALATQ